MEDLKPLIIEVLIVIILCVFNGVIVPTIKSSETKIDEEEIVLQENKKEPIVEAFSGEINNISGLNYFVLGNKELSKNILFGNKYSELEGILCFRGNNYRNSPSYGICNIKDNGLSEDWKFNTSSSSWGGGAGWTGQPAIIKWPEEIKSKMNIKDEFKNDKDFTEVIYASLDGNIYFLDLATGKESRNKIRVGNPIKGSLSIDPRGLPLLYVGEGINESGIVGFNIYNLIDGTKLYEVSGGDKDALRGWPAFDSSAIIHGDSDTIIEGGENGLLYLIKLNTNYDKEKNKITVNPEFIKYRYTVNNSTGRLGIENSVAAYRNLVYFADNNGDIQCIDINRMEPVWLVRSGDDTDASLTIDIEEGVPYIYTGTEVDHQGTVGTAILRKINGFTGEILWEKGFKCESIIGADAVNGGLMATNIIGKNNIEDRVIFSLARYKGFNKGATLALDKKNGEVLWEKDYENYMWSSPVDIYDEDKNGYIIQCDSVGNMFLIDGKSGGELGKILLNGNVEASPAIFNNTIVVATRNGTIYGIKVK